MRQAMNGSKDRCRIYLVRHGQTVMNVEVRFRGRLDIPLNDKGREEAQFVARELAHAGLAAIYTSPLCRAREVAEAISATSDAEVRDLDGLINLDYGEWEGLTKDECAHRDPEAWRLYRKEPDRARCPGGEALADAADRITAALMSLARRHRGQTIAAVSHGAMVRLALRRLAAPINGSWEVPLATGSATIFDVHDGRASLVVSPGPTAAGAPDRVTTRGPVGAPLFRQPLVVTDRSS